MIRHVVLTAVVAAGVTATAAAAPRTSPGWPVPAASGTLLPGPSNGIAVAADGDIADGTFGSTIAAFRLNGTRRWLAAEFWACGNCQGRGTPTRLQLDGTYGPLGEGFNTWGVTAAGVKIRPACGGLILADGTCISYTGLSLTAIRGGTTLWTFTPAQSPEFFQPNVQRDGAGTVYTDNGTGTFAVGEGDGLLKWTDAGVLPRITLASGVIVWSRSGAGLQRRAPDGSVVWSNPTVGAGSSTPETFANEAANRLYVSQGSALIALDLTTGAEVWRRAIPAARLLSVAANGTVYVAAALNRGTPSRRFALRAFAANGANRFAWNSTGPVTSARRLVDGTVAVSTAFDDTSLPAGEAGLLWRINPALQAPVVRRLAVSVINPSFRGTSCEVRNRVDCWFRRDTAPLLRVALPAGGTVRARLLKPNGTLVAGATFGTRRLQAGVGYLRLRFFGFAFTKGPRLVEVKVTIGGKTTTRRFPVTVT